jgi:hypothetical protein
MSTMMIDIDNLTEFLFERTTTILDKSGFYFVDDDINTTVITKTFTLHDTKDQQIPLCKVTSWLTQYHQFINVKNFKRKLTQLQVEGPLDVTETCFLNKTPHTHQIWNIYLQQPEQGQ